MKFTIAKEQLISGFQAVQNIVSTRTTLPILSNVLFRADENGLQLTATDLDVTVVCSVPAQVATPGAITLPAKRLASLVRELPASEIELELGEKQTCSIRAGSSFYKVNGLAPEEFPPLPQFQETRCVKAPQATLRNMLRRTSFAISTDESRYVLNGIFISVREDKITMVATDGRRLALAEEEVANPTQGQFIVPTKAINELNRLLQENGDVEIRFTDNQASFNLKAEQGPAIVLISKLVEGNYPNYEQVIPKETKERIGLGREELLQALRRAEIMTSDKSNSVKLTFGKNNLAITANTPDVCEARESLAINYKGAEISIAFNPTYLMDPLKALDNDEVFMELSDDLSPGLLKINGPFLYVIMPMRTN
jgi:DNA polymerase-3 subunit beta